VLSRADALHAYFYFYFPSKPHMVINALLAGLQPDQSVHVNRSTLEFLISHMPIASGVNSLEETIRLVEGALITLSI